METLTSDVAGVQTIITGDDGDIHHNVAGVQTIITSDERHTHQ